MTEKELRRLSRTDLLELLLAQRKENEQLRCILDETQAQLADRTIKKILSNLKFKLNIEMR